MSDERPENPFKEDVAPQLKRGRGRPPNAPKIDAPVTPGELKPPEDPEESEHLLGRARSSFLPYEQAYILELMDGYLGMLEKHPSVRAFVNEIILTDIEMQRHDKAVEKEREKWVGKATDENSQWLLKQDKVRASIMKRHTAALEAIGALPKDTMQNVKKDETLSDVHLRYAKEIRERKARGQRIGEPSEEAKELLRADGKDVMKYRTESMVSDEDRDAAIESIESESENG